jgi:hypothetical protein
MVSWIWWTQSQFAASLGASKGRDRRGGDVADRWQDGAALISKGRREAFGARELVLPGSVGRGILSLNKAVIWWMSVDVAESELGVLTTQCLDRRIPHKRPLSNEIAAWETDRNANHAKADWQFTTNEACDRTSET